MKKESGKRPAARPSRRRFTKTIVAAIVSAPLAATVEAGAQTSQKPPEAKAPPNPQPSPTPPQAQTSKPSPLAEAYTEVARVRFGEQVKPDDLTRMTRDLEGNVRNSDRLRAFKLQNSDEPDFIFNA